MNPYLGNIEWCVVHVLFQSDTSVMTSFTEQVKSMSLKEKQNINCTKVFKLYFAVFLKHICVSSPGFSVWCVDLL